MESVDSLAGEMEHAGMPMILSAPFSITLEVTTRCNYRCIHCYLRNQGPQEAGSRQENEYPACGCGKELGTEEIKGLLDDMSSLGVWWLTVTGGEPLLRRDFFEISSYARSKGFGSTLFTNGSLVDREAAQKISRCYSGVQVSLDAADQDTFKEIRGCGGNGFQDTVNGIRNLVKAGIPPAIAVTVFKQNLDQLDDIVDLAMSLGCGKIRFGAINPMSRDQRDWSFIPSNEAWIRGVEEVSEKYGERVQSDFAHPVRILAVLESRLARGDYRRSFCGGGTSHGTISSTGNVLPCPIFVGGFQPAGNIRERSLTDIWTDSDSFPFLRNFKENIDKIPMCSQCRYKLVCGGLCRARALGYGGSISSAPPTCPLEYIKEHPQEVREAEKKYVKEIYPERSPTVLYRFEEKHHLGILYDQKTRRFRTLNDVAYLIWQLSDGARTRELIVEHITQNYQVDPGQAFRDTTQTLKEMEDQAIIKA